MTTIFTSKIEELPPTSDTKMIDVWLIGCLLVPFTEVVLRTIIEVLGYCDHCMILEAKEAQRENEKIIAWEKVKSSHVSLSGVNDLNHGPVELSVTDGRVSIQHWFQSNVDITHPLYLRILVEMRTWAHQHGLSPPQRTAVGERIGWQELRPLVE